MPKEDFRNDFRQQLANIQSNAKDNETKELLSNNLNLIKELIEKETSLGETFRNRQPEFVLTHGDITGLNIIKSKEGLKLTDWDGTMFAPAERDINFLFDNTNFPKNDYLTKTGKKSIDPKIQEYYYLKWSLGSILDNFTDLNSHETRDIDKVEHVAEIEQYLGYYK